MPQDKVTYGFLILKVPHLSASINENSHGFGVLMWEGVGIETAMFAEYENMVVMPHISKVWFNIAGVNDKIENVSNLLHAVHLTDGWMTLLKALRDPKSLKEKISKNIDQINYHKQANDIHVSGRRVEIISTHLPKFSLWLVSCQNTSQQDQPTSRSCRQANSCTIAPWAATRKKRCSKASVSSSAVNDASPCARCWCVASHS